MSFTQLVTGVISEVAQDFAVHSTGTSRIYFRYRIAAGDHRQPYICRHSGDNSV